MTELMYEPIPDVAKVYPIFDDDFSTMEHAEVNSEAWTARISTAGDIKSVTDPDGKEYTSFEQLQAINVKAFKLVCEHEVEIDGYCEPSEPPDVEDGVPYTDAVDDQDGASELSPMVPEHRDY